MSESKEQFYRNHYENWKSVGGSIKGYCGKHNLISSTFTYWKQKFEPTQIESKFKEVKIDKLTSDLIQIIKPNGTEIILPLNCPINIIQNLIHC